MNEQIDRRQFLARSTLAVPAVGLGSLGLSAGLAGGCSAPAAGTAVGDRPGAGADRMQWFRISLAAWSLHRHLRGQVQPALDHLDLPATARRLDIDGLEYVNTFFKDRARDRAYLAELKGRADGEGVASLLIMCDGEGAIGDPDDTARTTAVENHYRWVDAASSLGCHAIRVNAQSRGSREEQAALAADGLRRLSEHAAGHDISVLVENHGGLSSDGSWLAKVMRRVDHPNCGTLPDFGNFNLGAGRRYDRYRGVAELMPFARAVSAKSYAFDQAGNETTIDYLRMMKIVRDAGYRGHVGIEFEGRELDEYQGIRMTKLLLERVRAELA